MIRTPHAVYIMNSPGEENSLGTRAVLPEKKKSRKGRLKEDPQVRAQPGDLYNRRGKKQTSSWGALLELNPSRTTKSP